MNEKTTDWDEITYCICTSNSLVVFQKYFYNLFFRWTIFDNANNFEN